MNTVNDTINQATGTTAGQAAQPQIPSNGATAAGNGTHVITNRRMLYRHPSDKLVAGVCGGVAEYLNWNPVLVRVIWVVATFATWGGGFLAYVLLALFLPTGTNTVGQLRPPALELSQKGMSWAAGILMGMGGLWLLANLGILPGIWRGFWGTIGILFWPALLIGAGYLLLRANSEKDLDKEVTDAARKVKDAFGDKLPSGDQFKAGFSSVRTSMPLRRSSTNKMFMGVCGGIGDKFGIDANLVRLIWAAFALGTMGLGAVLYFLVGLFLPEAGVQPVVPSRNGAGPEKVQTINIVDGSSQRTS
jgi:phage shock protein PspC (stress-responsive transcriptional regulator)